VRPKATAETAASASRSAVNKSPAFSLVEDHR
jgi:hypothetical protein